MSCLGKCCLPLQVGACAQPWRGRHSQMQSSRAQCQRCRFKFVQGNFSIHWSGIHKKKKNTKKQNAKWNEETNKTKQDKTRQNPCSVRAILVAGETRACYALSATWLAALDLTRRRLAKQIQIRRPTTKSSSVWPTTLPPTAPPPHCFQFKLNKLPVCLHSPKYLKSKSRFLILLYTRITCTHPPPPLPLESRPTSVSPCHHSDQGFEGKKKKGRRHGSPRCLFGFFHCFEYAFTLSLLLVNNPVQLFYSFSLLKAAAVQRK